MQLVRRFKAPAATIFEKRGMKRCSTSRRFTMSPTAAKMLWEREEQVVAHLLFILGVRVQLWNECNGTGRQLMDDLTPSLAPRA